MEAQETKYWLRLLKESSYISENEFGSIEPNLIELIKILTAILKSSREKNSTT